MKLKKIVHFTCTYTILPENNNEGRIGIMTNLDNGLILKSIWCPLVSHVVPHLFSLHPYFQLSVNQYLSSSPSCFSSIVQSWWKLLSRNILISFSVQIQFANQFHESRNHSNEPVQYQVPLSLVPLQMWFCMGYQHSAKYNYRLIIFTAEYCVSAIDCP